jgi:Tn3 transposase DDE domain
MGFSARTTSSTAARESCTGHTTRAWRSSSALGLVLNCITWNTVYLDTAIKQLHAGGYPVMDADVARLSPYLRRHLNVHGHYSFQLPELGGGRRPLRHPAADEEE